MTVPLNDEVTDVNFGYAPTGTIAGTVYNDTDANGMFDGTEPGIPGVSGNLYDDVNGNGDIDAVDDLSDPRVTNRSGDYSFT